MNLEACDIGISPTQWQKNLHPTAYHPKIEVIHEGIDTDTPSNRLCSRFCDGVDSDQLCRPRTRHMPSEI